MKNIVFIGMPGCGKTTISRLAALRLGREWFDSDMEIETIEGRDIPEIFSLEGEDYFRARETDCIKRLMRYQNAVISVGGGAVLRNAELLKSGTVVYLKRDVADIMATLAKDTRPLASDERKLRQLYDERREIYERLCDCAVVNNGAIDDAVKNVLEAIA